MKKKLPCSFDWNKLEQTHDLSLPEWGPYSSRTFGISHIHDPEAGTILDMVLMPGFYRRPLAIPDARRPSGGIPWRCSADLKQYSYRQQLEWKDKVYADLEFVECSPEIHRLRCRLVNNTNRTQDLAAQLLTRLIPRRQEQCICPEALEIIPPELPGCGLNSDMMNPGEEISPESILKDTCYPVSAGTVMTFHAEKSLSGKDLYLVKQSEAKNWKTVKLPAQKGNTFQYTAPSDETINRLLVVPEGVMPQLKYLPRNSEVFWEQTGTGKYLLHFGDGLDYYGIISASVPSFHRNYMAKDLLKNFTYCDYVLQKHPGDTIREPGGTEGGFAIAIQPVTIPAGAKQDIDFWICSGSRKRVRHFLNRTALPALPPPSILTLPGSPYLFSMERMASVIMTNVVYPIRCSGKFVRNHTPGRLWNCLYTWDSGFIGLALLDLDYRRAVENLNAYLTEKGNQKNAFVLHGTPLPMQIFLCYELWNRSCDKEMLRHFYPRVKQMYDFLAGHAAGSQTRSHCKIPMICTWDYFYNSGGWDDYPPQWERTLHPDKYHVIPVISTSCIIRCAKLLRALAEILGESAEVYDKDIKELSETLQKYSWDPETGYFSYINVNQNGDPEGFFRYKDGSNYNMGLDGVSPLIADAVTEEQRSGLWEKLQSSEHLWTKSGISAVDQSAPYFTPDGYWNGSVWMPHQWLLWKAALNDGMSRFAEKIAHTALRLWERETTKHYGCFEQFSIASGSGMGWHHFSGLSSPVICWHRAYFEDDALTAGFDVLITKCSKKRWSLKISGRSGEKTSLILGGIPRTVFYNGRIIPFRKSFGNSVIFNLPKGTSGVLEVISN